MRTSGGRYVRTEPDGTLRAKRCFPTGEETLELVARDAGEVLLKDFRGGWLVLAGPAGRTLRAVAAPAGQPLLVSEAGEGRVTLQVPGAGRPLALDLGSTPKSGTKPAEKPAADKGRTEQTLEICNTTETPGESSRNTGFTGPRAGGRGASRAKSTDRLTTHKREKYDRPAHASATRGRRSGIAC